MTYKYPKRKKCRYCAKLFKPKSNNIKRQIYCSDPRTCKEDAKRDYDFQWRLENPGYMAKKAKAFRKEARNGRATEKGNDQTEKGNDQTDADAANATSESRPRPTEKGRKPRTRAGRSNSC